MCIHTCIYLFTHENVPQDSFCFWWIQRGWLWPPLTDCIVYSVKNEPIVPIQ